MNDKERILRCGYDALNNLELAKRELKSAKGWGIIDLCGGGLFSGLMKHSDMSNAGAYIDNARYSIQEMGDLVRASEIANMDVGHFDILTFFDLFYDSFLPDLFSSLRIKEALDRIDGAIYELSDIIRRIELDYQ